MVDPERYYDLERYLVEDVGPKFAAEGSLSAFDFFSIVIWKANRAKSKVAKRLLNKDARRRKDLEPIVRDLTRALHHASTDEARLRLLIESWGFALPMASAILSILFPETFTVYDVRVCEQLGRFRELSNRTAFDRVWSGYLRYRDAVNQAVPGSATLRQKDRRLWGQSVAEQLRRDLARRFRKNCGLTVR